MSIPVQARMAGDTQTQRLMASLKVQAGDSPHPAMLALARRSRGTRGRNRRLAEFLRIERGRLA
jgi:hypothetical protein